MRTLTATFDGETQALGAPRVGAWVPTVGLGALVTPGTPIGRLRTHGTWQEVVAPDGHAGAVVAVTPAHTWCGWSQPLLELGEAQGVELAVATAAVEEGVPEDVTVVRAEIDGTIYLRPEPGAPAFVDEGAHVELRATIGLTEVMKTFSPVRAPFAGTVVSVRVTDGAAVTVGQPLFWMRA